MAESNLIADSINAVGCMFLGVMFELLLWGFSVAQSLYYFYEYSDDHKAIQGMVAFLWLLDTARTFCNLQFIWFYLVDNHANLDGLSEFTGSFVAEAFLATLIILIVQLYYIHTIWYLVRRMWRRLSLTTTMWTYYLMGICAMLISVGKVILVLVSFCGGLGSVYFLSVDKNITSGIARAEVPASVQTVTSFVADVFIAVALSVVLHDKRTAFAGTSSLITKLVMYVLNRGILTALIQLVEFTTYISLKSGPNKLVFIVFYFPGTKIYTNSVLAMLNIRHWLRQSSDEFESFESDG